MMPTHYIPVAINLQARSVRRRSRRKSLAYGTTAWGGLPEVPTWGTPREVLPWGTHPRRRELFLRRLGRDLT